MRNGLKTRVLNPQILPQLKTPHSGKPKRGSFNGFSAIIKLRGHHMMAPRCISVYFAGSSGAMTSGKRSAQPMHFVKSPLIPLWKKSSICGLGGKSKT